MRVGHFEINEPVPALKEPHLLTMLRPWIDVGSVGTITLSRLERYFNAQELGKLARPGTFFDFTRYRPMISYSEGKRVVTVPNTFLHYSMPKDGPHLIFLHMLEPHMFGEDYTDSIVEVLKFFGVKRYAMIGAMYDAVPHTRPLSVTGTLADLAKGIDRPQVTGRYEGPSTITTLVTQHATEMGIENASLMVHLPHYAQLEEDFNGVAAALEVVAKVYGLPPQLADRKAGVAQYEELNRAVSQNPRLKPVVEQLEANYDARRTSQPQASQPVSPLSPEVEQFLREMDQRFGGPGQQGQS